MIYEYLCTHCKHVFDVIKSIKDLDRVEPCEVCGKEARRQFTPKVHFIGSSVEHAEYNPALGCVVKGRKHKRELLKQHGLEEVGNESPEKMHKKFEKEREEKRERSWEEV